MAKFDCVLLDFDGTIADTSEGIFEGIRYGIKMEGLPQPSPEDMKNPGMFMLDSNKENVVLAMA